MYKGLLTQALAKLFLGVIILGILIFLPAGSYHYWQGSTILFLAMPLVLASPISFMIMLLYIPVIAKRIKNEEKVLEEGLEGYAEYKEKVKYKVLPFIW